MKTNLVLTIRCSSRSYLVLTNKTTNNIQKKQKRINVIFFGSGIFFTTILTCNFIFLFLQQITKVEDLLKPWLDYQDLEGYDEGRRLSHISAIKLLSLRDR